MIGNLVGLQFSEPKTWIWALAYANLTTEIFTTAILQNIQEIFCLCNFLATFGQKSGGIRLKIA